jgi:FMN phosphatase YigB (HAD superfamily)
MIKGIIFDLDGTLYQRSNMLYKKMSLLIRQWFINQLNIPHGEEDIFFEKLRVSYPSALEAIEKFGLSIYSFHDCVFDKLEPELYLSKDDRLIEILSILSGNKFLVTLSSQNHYEKVLNILGIQGFFKEIYNPGIKWQTCHKIDVYNTICKKYDYAPDEVCVVGDNYIVDLKDAHDKGYLCVLVNEVNGVIHTIQNINLLLNLIN